MLPLREKQGRVIFSRQYDERKVRPLGSTLLFLFLAPCLGQRVRDEKCLSPSDWSKRRSDNKALWLRLHRPGSIKRFDMRTNVCVCVFQRGREKKKEKR